jgi:arsenate reductase-like glutaredoxin family protein
MKRAKDAEKMSNKIVKLTAEQLKHIIREESDKAKKLKDVEDVKATETDADELADSLEKHVDFIKALKIEESRLVKRLNEVRKQKAAAVQKVLKNV